MSWPIDLTEPRWGFWVVCGCWGKIVSVCKVGCSQRLIRSGGESGRQLRAVRVAAIVALVVFLTAPNLPRPTAAQTPWINQKAAVSYASDLINDYNAFVDSEQATWANFTSIQSHFSLYHALGDSFEVIVVKSTTITINSNGTDVVGFIFMPIASPQPQIIVEQNETLEDLTNVNPFAVITRLLNSTAVGSIEDTCEMSPLHYGTAFYSCMMNEPTQVKYLPLVWVTSISTEVQNDTFASAKTAAQIIYRNDEISTIPPPPTLADEVFGFIKTYIYGVLFAVVSFLASVIYLREKGYLGGHSKTSKKKRPKRQR